MNAAVPRLVRLAIIAVALLLAGLLVPDIVIDFGEETEGTLLALALLSLAFGAVNAFLQPIARVISIPLNVLSLGTFSVVLNAALLLVLAFAVDLVWDGLIVVGGFPPDLGLEALVTAMVGSFIISVISTALTILIPDT